MKFNSDKDLVRVNTHRDKIQKIAEKLMIFGKYQLLSINQNLFTGEEGCDITKRNMNGHVCII